MPPTSQQWNLKDRLPRRLLSVALLGFSSFLVATVPGNTEEPSSNAPKAAHRDHIVIQQCRVELIDSVELACERAGVLDLVAGEGQQVKKGDVVAHVRDSLSRMALEIANKRADNDVEIRYARKAQELEELKYLRSLKANKEFSGTVSDLDLREQRLSAEKALLLLEQSRNELAINLLKRDEAAQRLKLHRVEAPFSGMVREVHKRQGESTTAGETILELVNTDRVRVAGSVPLLYVRGIKIGDPVIVHVNIPSSRSLKPIRVRGKLTFIDVRLEPLSETVKCWAEVANTHGILRAGMSATMTIHSSRSSPLAAEKFPFSKTVHVKNRFPERNTTRR
ncbi:MAG: efflux RND transporter periplasmic adaptor subunit [Planctomycetes bacterium]|nr:efflux RND transporter periplasmic adaptor subunit [Planctomycetota bacterium]